MIEYIREQLSQEELLCQLAEEAAELAQAALKLRRVLDGTNYTPATFEQALDNFREEIADVYLCVDVLDFENPVDTNKRYTEKIERWAARLKAARPEEL